MNKFIIASVVAVGLVGLSAQAQVAKWTFETSLPTTAGPISPEVGSGSGTAVGLGGFNSPAGNGSAHSWSANQWSVGDYWQFQVDLTGLSSNVVEWDQTSSGTGPRDFVLQYSTDGSTFTQFGGTLTVLSNGGTPNAAWSATGAIVAAYHFSVDLSSITALDNNATDYYRIVNNSTSSSNGGTTAAGGTDRIDNFTVSAIPEPSTVALVGFGLAGLLAIRRRRS